MRRGLGIRYADLIRRADRPKGRHVSQRLIRKHVIGYVNGRPVFRVFGAQPDGDEGNESGSGEGGDSGGTGSEGSDGGEDTGSSSSGETVSKEEHERLKARMQAADKSAAEALKKVKEFEDKDKSETERLTSQVEDLTKTNADLVEENKRLRFDNAFAMQSKHSWQDPEIVLGLVRNHEAVTVEEDGTIKGLDKALEAIAKTKPYLLKSDEGGDGQQPPPASGSGTGSGKKNDPSKMDEDALRKKYPALQI